MKTESLPPWGVMEEFVENQIRTRPIPEVWKALDPHKSSEGEWMRWRKDLVDTLASTIWPTFDTVRLNWSAPPNASLIEADFALLKKLHGRMNEDVKGLGQPPVKHEVFFYEEDGDDVDGSVGFGAHYERYDPGLPQYLTANMTPILWNGCNRKIGSLHYQIKKIFQRPRAYQVAAIQNRKFSCIWAESGGTPSLVSGHCLQASIAGCSAYVLFGASVDAVSVEVLKQFTVDIGDRRVFAGVHYPSDNLASWITAFHLLPHVFEPTSLPLVRSFLWDAVVSKSAVYAAIREHVRRNKASPYKPAVTVLEGLSSDV